MDMFGALCNFSLHYALFMILALIGTNDSRSYICTCMSPYWRRRLLPLALNDGQTDFFFKIQMQLPRKGHNYEAQPSQCSETKRYGEQTMTKKHNSTVAITNIQIKADPANTLRDYNIVTTSLLRRYVFAGGAGSCLFNVASMSTLMRRCFNDTCPLGKSCDSGTAVQPLFQRQIFAF